MPFASVSSILLQHVVSALFSDVTANSTTDAKDAPAEAVNVFFTRLTKLVVDSHCLHVV